MENGGTEKLGNSTFGVRAKLGITGVNPGHAGMPTGRATLTVQIRQLTS
jgi:hypothetical protein